MADEAVDVLRRLLLPRPGAAAPAMTPQSEQETESESEVGRAQRAQLWTTVSSRPPDSESEDILIELGDIEGEGDGMQTRLCKTG